MARKKKRSIKKKKPQSNFSWKDLFHTTLVRIIYDTVVDFLKDIFQ